MNKLQLVNRARQKAGVPGDDLTSLANQPAEVVRITNWINEAWMDIQLRRPDWLWMRSDFSFPTVAGQASYTAAQCGITDWGNWAADNFRNYVTASGTNSEVFMDFWPYEGWRDTYQFSGNRNVQARPVVCAITPDKSLALGPYPAAGYTVTGSYYKVASELAVDVDVPSLPSQFHMAIVYRAMMFYGVFEAAQEVYTEGQNEFDKMIGRIERHQMHPISFGGALA